MILRTMTALGMALAVAACGQDTSTNSSTTTVVTDNSAMADAVVNDALANGAVSASSANADLVDAKGTGAGTATAIADANGTVKITLSATGLTPGVHGVHVHTTGRCDAPKFESAGSHWNPTSKAHGAENANGPHAGDMPNLTAGTDGTARADLTLPAGTMAELLDADGAAIVVHAKADDLKTDPSGNSGDRIACGVFKAA